MDTATVIAIVVFAIAVVVALALYVQQRRSRRLKEHFGAEYATAVDELGDKQRAEAELRAREERVSKLDVRPLSASQAERFTARWRTTQAEFVDSPGAAIAYADDLLGEVMAARGYPVADFEQRAADLSVDHAALVSNYRDAHSVALRHGRGEASTEDLRRAMIHYRDLFAELVAPVGLGVAAAEPRSFQEETQDERAARATDDTRERGFDDRATRERSR